ncbi:Chid1, partial [Columba guinea]
PRLEGRHQETATSAGLPALLRRHVGATGSLPTIPRLSLSPSYFSLRRPRAPRQPAGRGRRLYFRSGGGRDLNLYVFRAGEFDMGKSTMRLLCTSLSLTMVCWLAEGTLSKTDAKKGATKKMEEKMLHSDKNVQDRGLVVVDPKAKDIIVEHRSYCSKKMKERHFSGDVLGYVTPWNSHGYDIAKIFGNKFTLISPVWLQVKRRGKERFQFTGLHDADKDWMKDVRKNSKTIRIVPRILFDGWTYQDFESIFGSEDEIEELSKNMVLLAKNENFDGFVVEVWSQLGNRKQTELIHLLIHLSEALHEAQLKLILVIPPAVAAGHMGIYSLSLTPEARVEATISPLDS